MGRAKNELMPDDLSSAEDYSTREKTKVDANNEQIGLSEEKADPTPEGAKKYAEKQRKIRQYDEDLPVVIGNIERKRKGR